MKWFWLWALPDLAKFSSERTQREALKKARDSSLNSTEYIGVALWLVITTSFGRYILNEGQMSSDVMATIVVNVLLVVPLLLAVFIPIHIRRLRRGLRQQLEQRGER
jgi:hypothetical protein